MAADANRVPVCRHDAERAGHSLLTLAVDDLDACASHLRENGFAYREHSDGGAPRRLLINDDDGNTIALFQDPTRPLSSARLRLVDLVVASLLSLTDDF
jgi:hypothetical protein